MSRLLNSDSFNLWLLNLGELQDYSNFFSLNGCLKLSKVRTNEVQINKVRLNLVILYFITIYMIWAGSIVICYTNITQMFWVFDCCRCLLGRVYQLKSHTLRWDCLLKERIRRWRALVCVSAPALAPPHGIYLWTESPAKLLLKSSSVQRSLSRTTRLSLRSTTIPFSLIQVGLH